MLLETNISVNRQCTCHPDDNPPTPCEHRYAFRDCADAAEERYLRETLAILQESYAKAAKPYIDRLVAIRSLRQPRMMVTVAEAEAMGFKGPTLRLTGRRKRPKKAKMSDEVAPLSAVRVEPVVSSPCPDCGAHPGEQHKDGCDVERCPDCGGQIISCDCDGDIDMPRLPWTGEWPGKMECREFGWYSKMVPGKGWTPCNKNEPGAGENLNRLYFDAVWSKKQGRFVLPANGAGSSAMIGI